MENKTLSTAFSNSIFSDECETCNCFKVLGEDDWNKMSNIKHKYMCHIKEGDSPCVRMKSSEISNRLLPIIIDLKNRKDKNECMRRWEDSREINDFHEYEKYMNELEEYIKKLPSWLDRKE